MSLLNNDPLQTILDNEKKANEFGLCWEDIYQVLDQIKSECEEVKSAWEKQDKANLREEIGDLISASLSLAAFCQLDIPDTIQRSNHKFSLRFKLLKELVTKDGLTNLHGQPLNILISYWNKAKEASSHLDFT